MCNSSKRFLNFVLLPKSFKAICNKSKQLNFIHLVVQKVNNSPC